MKTAQDLVAEAKASVKEISPDEAQQLLGETDLLIDVREPAEYQEAHIAGALHIPRGMLEFKLSMDPQLEDRSRSVILYCKSSGRAALAAVAMQQMGYLNVKSIAGGIEAWRAAGKPVVQPQLPEFE